MWQTNLIGSGNHNISLAKMKPSLIEHQRHAIVETAYHFLGGPISMHNFTAVNRPNGAIWCQDKHHLYQQAMPTVPIGTYPASRIMNRLNCVQ